MTQIHISLALADYDHVKDVTNGNVPVQGVDLTVLTLPVEEIFFRFLTYREFHASEMSLAKLTALMSQPDCDLVAIPVFPSRIHRHSSIYVRTDGPVKTPKDLEGRRVGLPEWAQTAAVYSRGFLADQYAVELSAIRWVQAGVNQPGRSEKVLLNLPPGIEIERCPTRTLNDLLLSGEIDAVLSAHPPQSIEDGDPRIRRLFENFLEVEQDYLRHTGIFPIMHTVVLRRDVYDANPWVAAELFKALDEAKDRSVARALDFTASRFPIPWGAAHANRAMADWPNDYFPYGVTKNLRTLDAFLGYAYAQGVAAKRLQPQDLFAPNTLDEVRI